MKKAAVVFISDIHYCEEKSKSQFQENDENEYYQKWENFVASIEDIQVKYLVILGDIVDTARIKEYRIIIEYLNKFCDKFNIKKENVLVIPGNHDINRFGLANICDKGGINEEEAYKRNREKLDNYIDFYKEFKEKDDLNVDFAILDSIEIEEEDAIILGVNSLVRESHRECDHYGYVDVQKFNQELGKYRNKKKKIIVAAHHSFTETNHKELATIKNAQSFIESLGQNDINIFICGHIHTSESKKDIVGDEENVLNFLEIGSVGKIFSHNKGESYNNRFSIAVCEPKKFVIHDYFYTAENWIEGIDQKQCREILLFSENEELLNGNVKQDLPEVEVCTENNIEEKHTYYQSKVYLYDKSEFLFEYLKKEGNYKEGHFHWSDKKKTLGWINIAAFLGNIDILEKIKECITDIFEKNMCGVQVVVGYGMEGNIIGSSLTDYWVEHDIGYYFYPSVHKDNEHIDLEKSLWNEYNEYDDILLLCDIMPPEEYLNEIIRSNSKLNACSCVNVLSLFCNSNLLKNDKGKNLDDKEIKKYALAEFNVPVCGKDEKECLIYRQNLCKIYSL